MPIGIKGFQRGKDNPSYEKQPWNFGKHPSEETRKKLSESHRGYVMPESQRKKISVANKGKKKPPRSEEHTQKIAEKLRGRKQTPALIEKRISKIRGRKLSKEWKRKISEAHKGQKQSEEHRRKNSEVHRKENLSQETREKMSKAMIGRYNGEKNPNWRGGVSNNPYPKEFNSELKLKIRTRDNFTCCLCGRTEREELEELNQVLTVNHIDFDKDNCKESNLNTLCLRCNVKINREREYWIEYFKIHG